MPTSRSISLFVRVGLCLAFAAARMPALASAKIEIMGVSPRDVAASPSDIFDEVSAGLENVGVSAKVYFQAVPTEGATVTGYHWQIVASPSGSSAALSATDQEIVTLRPDKVGVWTIALGILETGNVVENVQQSINVATYAGAGVFNTHQPPDPHAPHCGTGFCHGGDNADPDLAVAPEWIQSHHAQKLQNHLKGQRGSDYDVSCLQCHTVGYNLNPEVENGGFDDVAHDIGYDLNQIPPLVADAFTFQVDNFPQMPAELQNLASIQCENCHGPGATHPASLQNPDHGISGVNLGFKQCAQCHDSLRPEGQQFYQWNTSSHPVTAEAAEGDVAKTASCLKCHTGEGFVDVQIEGKAPTVIPDPNSVTCSTCHDPHFSEFDHQLRVAGDYTFDSGQTFTGAGLGGLCMHCHNSRVSDPGVTVNTSSRGTHHGPQGDMLKGINGASFNLSFTSNSAHANVVSDKCVHCHMAPAPVPGAEPPTVGEHTFAMAVDTPQGEVNNVVNVCDGCHAGLSDYDRPARGDYDGDGVVEGIQTEIEGLFDLLQPGLLALGGTSVDPDTGKISITSGGFAALTEAQKSALYNYNFVMEDHSEGVHNAAYAVQLLQRSYWGVYGRPISKDLPGIKLRGPDDPSALPEGAPTLNQVIDQGNANARLLWSMPSVAEPAQFLGFAYDIYPQNFVNFGVNGLFQPFLSYATNGTLPLGRSGAYHVWVGTQYPDSSFFPTNTPFTGIIYSGMPHEPLNVTAQALPGVKAQLHWAPDIYGTFAYWVIAYQISSKSFVNTTGPLGSALWQGVAYGSSDFTNGTMTLKVPQPGQYVLFIGALAWDFQTFSEFASANVTVP
ncbi:MAG: multiheme c-type cytochrome [Candidatus Sumerlaeota bacterium]|nr:multiheme c-type cytochrome [Candidatus Sumerlaeota bacterium]